MKSIDILNESLKSHEELIKRINNDLKNQILLLSEKIIFILRNGGTIFWCGNGGSATDSLHLSAELLGRFQIKNSPPFKSISLTSDIALITCISNDFCYENIFERQIQGLGTTKDMLIALSTSGRSKNIINALKMAKSKGLTTASFLGKNIENTKSFVDYCISIPSDNVARIQEMHLLIGHIICQIVEDKLS
tara:strand:- start:3 stop:578 length:576 start_codon:yes stop_codon:yes gene_type:complete